MEVKNKQERAEILFSKTPIKKAIWIVTIPALLTAFMVGLYGFVDQVMIQHFVPRTTHLFGENGIIYDFLESGTTKINSIKYKELVILYNKSAAELPNKVMLQELTSNSIVAVSTVASQPLLIFSNSIVFLTPVGTSIYYTKCISKKMEFTGKNIWATSFWISVSLSLLSTIFMFIFSFSGLQKQLVGRTVLDTEVLEKIKTQFDEKTYREALLLQDYYDAGSKISLKFARQYILIFGAGTVLQGLVSLLSFFIRAEGHNTYIMFWGITANLINIGMDYILISIAKLGVLGGAIATVIGWTINVGAFVIYIIYMDRRKKTWMTFRNLFKFNFDKNILLPSFSLGVSGFLRSFGVAVSFAVLSLLYTKTSFSNPQFQVYWSKSSPILTLFLISIFGISDGARSLFSYNYTQKDFQRCKEVYYWTFGVAIIYGALVWIGVSATSYHFWTFALNASEESRAEVAKFISILMVRIFTVAFTICSLMVFQAANDSARSVLASVTENYIGLATIIPIGALVAYIVYYNTGNKNAACWVITAFFILNSLVSSLFLLGVSINYVFKKIPKMDEYTKLSWSKRLEKKFFDNAEILEKEWLEKTKKINAV